LGGDPPIHMRSAFCKRPKLAPIGRYSLSIAFRTKEEHFLALLRDVGHIRYIGDGVTSPCSTALRGRSFPKSQAGVVEDLAAKTRSSRQFKSIDLRKPFGSDASDGDWRDQNIEPARRLHRSHQSHIVGACAGLCERPLLRMPRQRMRRVSAHQGRSRRTFEQGCDGVHPSMRVEAGNGSGR
jgi:hypothetical protein